MQRKEHHLGADGHGQLDLGQIGLDCTHIASSGGRAHVDHQNLTLGQLLDLTRLLVPLLLYACL